MIIVAVCLGVSVDFSPCTLSKQIWFIFYLLICVAIVAGHVSKFLKCAVRFKCKTLAMAQRTKKLGERADKVNLIIKLGYFIVLIVGQFFR